MKRKIIEWLFNTTINDLGLPFYGAGTPPIIVIVFIAVIIILIGIGILIGRFWL